MLGRWWWCSRSGVKVGGAKPKTKKFIAIIVWLCFSV